MAALLDSVVSDDLSLSFCFRTRDELRCGFLFVTAACDLVLFL